MEIVLNMPIIELEVSDLSRGGAGVAKAQDGRVVFVPFTVPGDRVRVRILFEKKHYAQGEIVELLSPSPLRQAPPCPIFSQCGGCQWQHIPYELQWRTKAGGVRHALARLEVDIPEGAGGWEEFSAEQIWGYRNRVQLRGEGNQIGFYAAGSHKLIPADRCEIARKEINALWEEIRTEGAKLPLPYKAELAVGADGMVKIAWNAPHGAAGFRQIHDAQNEKLRQWVSKVLSPGLPLLDLFGGSGNLCTATADGRPEIHCVDVGAPKDRPPGIPVQIQFHRSEVALWMIRATRRLQPGRWAAITDPPRDGLGRDFIEIARAFEKIGVKELVAVGCEPDSWARDVARFMKQGWQLKKVAAFDFFPQTPHVEAAAFLKID